MEKELLSGQTFRFLDNMHEGVCLVNTDGTLLYANAAARKDLTLPEGARSLAEAQAISVASETWEMLLAEAPITVNLRTVTGRLTIESHLEELEGQPLVQLLTRLEKREGAVAASEQVSALERISRELNTTLLLEDLLESVLAEGLQVSGATSGEIVLLHAEGEGRSQIRRGAVVDTAAHDAQARRRQEIITVADLHTSAAEEDPDAGTPRSALISPVLFEGDVVGFIRLFSQQRNHFTEQNGSFLTALSHLTALAHGNARRFAVLRGRNILLQHQTQQIEHFVESSRIFHSERPLAEVYEDLVYAIQEGARFGAVLLSLAEEEGSRWMLRPVTAAGLPLERLHEVQRVRRPWDTVEQLMQSDFKLGAAYLVPAAAIAERSTVRSAVQGLDAVFPVQSFATEGKHASDLFFIPMRDSRGHPLGLISLSGPIDSRPPDLSIVRVLEIFANQAATAIENIKLFHNMRSYAQQLQQLHEVSQQTLREPDFDKKLELILNGLQAAGWRRVALTLRDEEFRPTKLVTTGLTPGEHDALKENMLPADLWRQQLDDPDYERFRRGTCYFIPAEAPQARATQEYGIVDGTRIADEAGAWHPEDILYRPLYNRHGQRVGLIGLDQPVDGRRPGKRTFQTVDLYAQFATSVIENHLLFSGMAARTQELQTLFEASRALSGTLDPQAVLREMGESMMQAVQADAYTVYALGRSRQDAVILQNVSRLPEQEAAPPGTPFDLNRLQLAQQVVETLEPVARHFRDQPSHPLAGKQPLADYSVAMLPLMVGKELFGLVEVVRARAESGFGEERFKLLSAILNQGSTALEMAHLFEELDERVAERTQALAAESERVKTLLRITTELTTSLDRDRVLNLALQLVNDVIKAEQGAILLIDEVSGELIIHAAFGADQSAPPGGVPSGLQRDEGLSGWIIARREAVVLDDALSDERWVDNQPGDHHSVLAVPLVAEDKVLGVMMLTHSAIGIFDKEQLSLVEAAAVQVANAIHNANLYDLIRQQAEKLGAMMREAQIEVAKVQSILQSIADGVLVARADGTIILANMAIVRILDVSRRELIGKSVDELSGLYGESGDAWVRVIEAWAADPDALEPQTSFKNQLEIEDRIVSVHVAPVFANDDYFGTISIFRDITREVEVDRMKSEFVSTVSHELRTPMTAIKGYADLMLMGAAGTLIGPQLRYLEVISKNADRLKALVDDLLNISRIETGKTQLKLQPVDVPQLVTDVVSNHLRGRIQHEDKKIHISTEMAPSLPLVNADPEKVTRILTNLVDNALNYTLADGEIEISAEANHDFVYISVRDTGIGISEEIQERIFDRFFRAEDQQVRSVPGTGLGLSIVSSLVDMHGGKISLESQPGVGSTFTFSLPRVPDVDTRTQKQFGLTVNRQVRQT